jgi:hypothetical protein
MDDKFDKERLFRERRLLLAVSFVLLAHQWLGITVGKSTDTLGLHFQFDDPSKLWSGVWLVWLWTIVCYIQQFYSLKPWTTYPMDRDDEARDRLSDLISLLRVRRAALMHLRADMPKGLRDKRQVAGEGRTETTMPGNQRQLRRHVSVTVSWSGDDLNLATAKAESLEKAMVTAGWEIRGGGVSVEGGKCSFCRVVSVRIVPVREERLTRIGARIWTIVWTSFFSDYIAPFIVGVAPVIIALARTMAASAAHMASHAGR